MLWLFVTLYFFPVEVELACIADWKDGSDVFMYGRLTAPTLLEDHTKYRCFVSLFSFPVSFKQTHQIHFGFSYLLWNSVYSVACQFWKLHLGEENLENFQLINV